MKLLLLSLLLGPLSAGAQPHKPGPPVSPVDTFFGFRDVRLETDIADHPEMKALVEADSVASDPDKTYYFRPRENPQIGETKATLIQYFYYKDKAEGVLVVVSGAAERQKLLTALRAKYGAPTQTSTAKGKAGQEEAYTWAGKKATLTLGKPDSKGEASMLLLSNALWQREQADRKRKAGAGL